MSSRHQLKLDWCSYDAARYACKRWHYSESVPTPPLVRIGVWEDDRFVGVVLFSRGSTRHLGRPYGLGPTEICELTRVALADHETPVSRMLAIAVKMLRRTNTGLRLIVSFADPNQGHTGIIYQAAGWLYTGQTASTRDFVDKAGRVWHERQISASGFKKQYGERRAVLRPDECRVRKLFGKHRYLLPLDGAIRERLLPFRKQPPRAGGADSGTPDDQLGGEGSIPISALSEETSKCS